MDYKVEFYPCFPLEHKFEKEVQTLDDAVLVFNTVADYTLLLHDTKLMFDYSNTGMIFRKEDGEWVEIDNDGNYI